MGIVDTINLRILSSCNAMAHIGQFPSFLSYIIFSYVSTFASENNFYLSENLYLKSLAKLRSKGNSKKPI